MRKKIKTISTVLFMVTAVVIAACSKPEQPENIDDLIQNDSVVDLGLPSGMLWAAFNVGATKPEECGDYVAWGEVVTKEMYDWKQYRYSCVVENDYLLTKYCTNPEYGFNGMVDSLTVLEPMDDVAVVNWGSGWRLPTKEEWRELLSNTTNTMTEQNGVKGRLFAGVNGNTLFLPNTGFFLDDTVICPTLAIYWTSSLQTTFQTVAWSFHSDLEECHVCGTYERSRGHCVRAVRSSL